MTFVPAGGTLPECNYDYRTLTDSELAGILRKLPKRPLLAGDNGIRLSLAGAQDKVAVRIENGEISLPLGGAPSTHILKPAVARFEGVVFNEALCMKLAAAFGLPAASVERRIRTALHLRDWMLPRHSFRDTIDRNATARRMASVNTEAPVSPSARQQRADLSDFLSYLSQPARILIPARITCS